MTGPTGIDESYSYANPQAAKDAGVEVAGMYLSHTPTKNATPAKITGYHRVGIGFLALWETTSNRALQGAAAGAADGADAAAQLEALIAAVGYAPKNKLAIVFAVDFDTNPGQYAAIDAYLTAAKHALAGRFLCGVYGEAALLDHTASAHVSEMEFGTYAWSAGRISSYDDFHQYLNGQKLAGADVDFDRVIHPVQVGAWWPPNSQYDTDSQGDNNMANMTPAELVALLEDPTVKVAMAKAVLTADVIPSPLTDPNAVHANPTWTLASYLKELYHRETQDIGVDVHDVALDTKP